jgi:hypothetical protein
MNGIVEHQNDEVFHDLPRKQWLIAAVPMYSRLFAGRTKCALFDARARRLSIENAK